ncbi:hypothetical protein CIRG_04664 [Coccidioides immitis RMSCC 2394]|uniref:Uncharacterized protein n=1 Tax=Coccidioides immitis RMSCC 2394 TaxID=404692 RepID=A0A0J6YDJ6_COCIT|nr:hypothetical protein CIRG_04664 [Coccidioides immitis RMSCC 2394]
MKFARVSLGEKTSGAHRDRTMTEKKEGNEDEQRQRGPEKETAERGERNRNSGAARQGPASIVRPPSSKMIRGQKTNQSKSQLLWGRWRRWWRSGGGGGTDGGGGGRSRAM